MPLISSHAGNKVAKRKFMHSLNKWFFKILFVVWLERERDTSTSICCSIYLCIHWLILVCALNGDWTHNLGVSDDTQTNWATQSGLKKWSLRGYWLVSTEEGKNILLPLWSLHSNGEITKMKTSQVIIMTLACNHRDMGSHWKVLSRWMMLFDTNFLMLCWK